MRMWKVLFRDWMWAALLVGVSASLGCDDGNERGSTPVETEQDPGESGIVSISLKAIERSGIKSSKVRLGNLSETIEAPAEVQFIPSKTAHVTSLVSGNISDVKVSRGERVKAGQALAVLSSMDLGEARARLSKARARVNVATSETERQKQLTDEGITAKRRLLESQAQLQEARAELEGAQAYLSVFSAAGGAGAAMPLKSPIDGVVSAAKAVRGENVQADVKLFTITDMSQVWAVGKVYEQDLAKVKVGLTAELELRAYPGKRWQGEVDFVPCELDEGSRSLQVRVTLDNSDGNLRRGLFGTLYISGINRSDAHDSGAQGHPIVPIGAVQKIGDNRVVFVPRGDQGTFEAKQVTTGTEADGQVEVTQGLTPDEQVVVEGAFTLKSQLLREQLGGE